MSIWCILIKIDIHMIYVYHIMVSIVIDEYYNTKFKTNLNNYVKHNVSRTGSLLFRLKYKKIQSIVYDIINIPNDIVLTIMLYINDILNIKYCIKNDIININVYGKMIYKKYKFNCSIHIKPLNLRFETKTSCYVIHDYVCYHNGECGNQVMSVYVASNYEFIKNFITIKPLLCDNITQPVIKKKLLLTCIMYCLNAICNTIRTTINQNIT